ncbi:unnamed protein product, partial [Sphacelaria rigidula]
MDDFPPPPPPLHVIIFVVQFSVPEMIPPGEARLLCKGVASALARSPFWLGMTVNLDGDEGDITTTNGSNDDIAAASTAASTTATSTPRGNAIGTRNCTTSSGGGCINPGTMSDSSSGAGGLGKHPRSVMTACCDGDPSDADHGAGRRVVGAAADAVTADAVAEAGKQFLRRYHHHVAFRRLAAPITDTETVEMPVPLFPTCIDTCGCMVALGTREGPVLLFD